ncbi:hypothetical protein RFI_11379 [Reticulomyxa filosa]|uniref:Uncharacterized protein n=1 Tax=Reticulomyxa filosa TaxID=46433 RepID=X6NIM9_RETFI|nr:hypothetical protein RFI_11379 [Reticulomyxa filosa]|eukprot:ETO25758.1 hypothetical protein RFI_11379 [Reticulomyxa filosa]
MEHAEKPAVGGRRRGKSTHKKITSDNGDEKEIDDEEQVKDDNSRAASQGGDSNATNTQVYASGAVEKAVDLVEDKATIPSASRREKSHRKVDTVNSPKAASHTSSTSHTVAGADNDSGKATAASSTQIYSSGAIEAAEVDLADKATIPTNRRMKSRKQVTGTSDAADDDHATTNNAETNAEHDAKHEESDPSVASAAQIYPSGAVEINYERSAAIPSRRRKRTVTKKFGDENDDDDDAHDNEKQND